MRVTDIAVEVRVHWKSRDDQWKAPAVTRWLAEAIGHGHSVVRLTTSTPDPATDLAVVIIGGQPYVLTPTEGGDTTTAWIQAVPEQQRREEVTHLARDRAAYASMPEPPF